MEMIYISHPFTGNEEENMKRAEALREKLQARNPEVLFINPLNLLEGKSSGKSVEHYSDDLSKALELLCRCDGMVMADGWKVSCGCKAEVAYAKKEGIPIYPMEKFAGKE